MSPWESQRLIFSLSSELFLFSLFSPASLKQVVLNPSYVLESLGGVFWNTDVPMHKLRPGSWGAPPNSESLHSQGHQYSNDPCPPPTRQVILRHPGLRPVT